MTQPSPGAATGAPLRTHAHNRIELDDLAEDIYIDVITPEGSIGRGMGGEERGSETSRPGRRLASLLPVLTALADAISAVAALAIGGVIVGSSLPGPILVALTSATWVGLLVAFGAYDAGLAGAVRAILGAAGVAGLLMAVAASQPDAGSVLVTVFALVASASIVRIVVSRVARAREPSQLRTAVVDPGGAGEVIDPVLADGTDMSPVIMLDISSSLGRKPASRTHTLPTVETDLGTMPGILAHLQIECLLVVGDLPRAQLESLRRVARRAGAEFRIAVAIPSVPVGEIRATSSGRAAVVTVGRPHRRAASFVKRGMDVTFGTFLLVLLSPLLIGVAVAIKLASRGPVTFRQWRVTRGGRPFKIVKFRTMDSSRAAAIEGSPAQPFFKLEDDPRLTPIGRVIRRLSLDELPQLWNVVRGDMSLVGPRPLPVEQVRANPELLGPRNDVRAGMTGWWQVNGRSDLQAEEAVGHDLFYIENWSLAFDVRILARTLPAIFSQRGAY